MLETQLDITVIAPKSNIKNASEISALAAPLSGPLILATMLHNEGHLVKFYDETLKIPDYEKIDSDYILISSMSCTVNRAYEIADFFKARGKKVIMGGLHVSYKSNESLQHCDKVVIGEAEHVIIDLINGKYNEDVINGTNVIDLDSIPLPNYDLIEGLSSHPKVVSLSSSRGCPFNCRFCSLNKVFGRKFRTVSTDRIIRYLQNFKTLKILRFDEPNFSINKERAINILTQMKEKSVQPKYVLMSLSIDVAQNDQFLKLCSDVCQFQFLIGLESISQKVLDSYNKKQTPEIIRKGIKKLHDYGIKVQGSFIFGSDFDDKNVFSDTVDFCQDAEVDFPQFVPLTPYVGTDIREDFERDNRIITNNWDYYDGEHVVIYPKNMTPYELQEGVANSYEDIYSNSKAFQHLKIGEVFYGIETLFVKSLIKKTIRENRDYFDYLSSLENDKKSLSN